MRQALLRCRRVYCAFVFDRDILDALPTRHDRRVDFIAGCLRELDAQLRQLGSGLIVMHDSAPPAITALAARLGAQVVFAGRDYEPDAVARDLEVARRLQADGRSLQLLKDQVIFQTDEVLTGAGRPFSVFTPYRNAWMRRLESLQAPGGADDPLADHEVRAIAAGRLAPPPADLRSAPLDGAGMPSGTEPVNGVPSLQTIGFEDTSLDALGVRPGASGAAVLLTDFVTRMGRYSEARDFPAIRGPSYLSVHLRFGTVSIRRLAREALTLIRSDPMAADGARTWLSELIWREFYAQILHHHPHTARQSFKPEYDAIAWESGPQAQACFAAFREGRTGYPLVDAAIAQINHSGYMHNRLRMVVASFLCKDLGLDWRWGERWFAQLLIDYDLAANAGGWQWAASSGCDAQPYFRIFNPITQSEKFDPKGSFIRRYLPQLAGFSDRQIHAPWLVPPAEQARLGCVIGRDYPAPIVDHAQARERTLQRYAVVKLKASG